MTLTDTLNVRERAYHAFPQARRITVRASGSEQLRGISLVARYPIGFPVPRAWRMPFLRAACALD